MQKQSTDANNTSPAADEAGRATVVEVPSPRNTAPNGDALEASMQLAHAEFVAAARLRREMDGHLNQAMEKKLNLSVATAGAKYVAALDAYEASC